MRRYIRSPQTHRTPSVAEPPAGQPPPPEHGVQAPPSPGVRLVRFPCGHTDTEAHITGRLRELKSSLGVGCSRCNVIAL